MRKKFIITSTDTDIGKTIFSAALMLGLEKAGYKPHYWKPIQCGIAETVDTKRVQKLTKLASERFFSEKYILTEPLSPHRAAELDDARIDIEALRDPKNIPVPEQDGVLIIEGAGGLMVPLTRENLLINLFQKWQIPVVLCARTGLGTLNHTLLSLEALWTRKIPIKGIVFIGDENEDNMKTIADFSKEKVLGRLPLIDDLDDTMLRLNFGNHFDVKDFIA
ncbi:MAG: ATP-dependent dethiobiotin synthetase BioD [Alphaproteobacteria bacterium]|nr:ATP-dependent dethiobiotin synthetase BioD [Alphaproteobacteria bacterium]